jgi:peptidoglycan/LPS O-acetylase OafA/YrhL
LNTDTRVLGWDLLRGVCALVVAFYHLSYWLGLAELPALGTYGVYLFFVLSGASLAYVYPLQRVNGAGDVARFLATRWLRLAPLYVALCLLHVALLALHKGAPLGELGWRFLLNATFTFGFEDPALTALLIGGWSLGIEFVYYLCFPLLARVLPQRLGAWLLLVALAALQGGWILATVGRHGWFDAVAAYHQAPAFAAYFFGGCLLGHRQRAHAPRSPGWMGALAAAAWVVLLLVLMPQKPGDELLGVRGVLLFLACFAAVHGCGRAQLHGRLAAIARWGGDITYGTYLLHPVLFFALARFVALPLTGVDVTTWPTPGRWALLLVVLVAATVLAICSERWLEAPVRRWGQRKLGRTRPAPTAQSDVASISS